MLNMAQERFFNQKCAAWFNLMPKWPILKSNFDLYFIKNFDSFIFLNFSLEDK